VISHGFYDGTQPGLAIEIHHDPTFVFLSVAVVCLASYAGLSIAELVSASEKKSFKQVWLWAGAWLMGSSVWAMHFIGLLSLKLPFRVHYDLFTTLLSGFPAIFACVIIISFTVDSRQRRKSALSILGAGTLLAANIGLMHLVGTLAMYGVDKELIMRVEPLLFGLLIVIAVALASVLLVFFFIGSETERWWVKIGVAAVVGLGIAGMHYTAMLSTYLFQGENISDDGRLTLNPSSLAISVAFVAILITLLAIALTFIDRRLKKAVVAEQVSRARLHEAIESIADALSFYDSEDRLILCNSRYRNLMEAGGLAILPGVPFERVIRNAAECSLILEAEGHIDDWMAERLAHHRRLRENFIEHWSADRWFQVSEHAVPNGGTVAIHTDITELKRTEIELSRTSTEAEQSRAAAEEANRSKSAFLANMSHELRTPLNAIIGYSEILSEDAEDAGRESELADLKKIRSAGKHLLALINDVLDVSKIEAGKMEVYLETFEVSPMLEDVVSTVAPLVAENDNRLDVHFVKDLGSLRADLTKVRQALFNLLSNASKFTTNGVITLAATRETVNGAEWISFAVSDTGIGISSEQTNKLFRAFSQAAASTSKKFGGTGLGLALSRRFCEMMGGDITVNSVPGQGSTFTIRLPIDGMAAAKTTAPTEVDSVARTSAQGSTTVLVIDDDPGTRELMQRFLDQQGLQMVGAASGEEGLKLAKELRPAVITLDVLMPGMDGWAVLATLKAEPALASIPVIMVTFVDDKNMGFALGANDFLTKPINRAHLAQILTKYSCASAPRPVLLVEDQADLRELMRHILEQEGWVVAEAENGRVALAKLADNCPELIVLDLMMPEMDGFSFLEALRQRAPWRLIPVVVVTAKDLTAEDRQRLNGYVQYIVRKGSHTREELLQEVAGRIAACVSEIALGAPV
jgi:signal transduction histidine kinase/CheY-like chemotaxis protein